MNVSRMMMILFTVVFITISLVLIVRRQTPESASQIAVGVGGRVQRGMTRPSYQGGMLLVDSDNANTTRHLDLNQEQLRPMSFSPDGKWLVSRTFGETDQSTLLISSVDGREHRDLLRDGKLNLWPNWSPNGEWIAYISVEGERVDLYRIRPDGSAQQRIVEGVHAMTPPQWSPDSRWLAYAADDDSNLDIYRVRADGTHKTRLTQNPAAESQPLWSPDGQGIAYVSKIEHQYDLYYMQHDGSAQHQIATLYHPQDSPFSWSPDSQWLVFEADGGDIYKVRRDGTNLQRLTSTNGRDLYPAWSPDGEWIAFLNTNQDGTTRLFKMRPDGAELHQIVDSSVAAAPIWSPTTDQASDIALFVMLGIGLGMMVKLMRMRNRYQGLEMAAA